MGSLVQGGPCATPPVPAQGAATPSSVSSRCCSARGSGSRGTRADEGVRPQKAKGL
jgi:hypothetical protein